MQTLGESGPKKLRAGQGAARSLLPYMLTTLHAVVSVTVDVSVAGPGLPTTENRDINTSKLVLIVAFSGLA